MFGKSVNQKTSPTSPQNSSPQKSANGGANVQQGQVDIYLLFCIKVFQRRRTKLLFQHVDNEFLDKLVEEMRRVKIIVKGHERRIKTLEERLSQYEAPVDDLDD